MNILRNSLNFLKIHFQTHYLEVFTYTSGVTMRGLFRYLSKLYSHNDSPDFTWIDGNHLAFHYCSVHVVRIGRRVPSELPIYRREFSFPYMQRTDRQSCANPEFFSGEGGGAMDGGARDILFAGVGGGVEAYYW